MGQVHPCLWDTQRCPLSTSQDPAERVLVQMLPVFNVTQTASQQTKSCGSCLFYYC